ncbi:MAG: hypothetical protein C4532_16610 [Candidatus Abyssobacteria bacterium SURF_17]|uniref:Uncharacterized protein n=1 Tax=Candidatus Abyssobacteria bacterium SURF_17 TaxID=2093361 RepID=A0A419ERJ3_9BACT|nr:MAG: hypothetical protein C4532_16610 [Candidatus Abyssubacteria bacterium SURF_17]
MKQLFPAAGEVGRWKPEGEPLSFRGEALFDHIDGGADIYFEYGFVILVTQQYKDEDRALSVEIYCMEDAAAAFGIYSYNRHPSLSPVEVGGDGTIHPNGLFYWQGRYYIDIRQVGTASVSSEDILTIGKAVEKNIGAAAERPEIMKLLPRENMVPHSEVFARGKLAINNQVYIAEEDLFGLAKDEVAALARYRAGLPEFSVIIAGYKSPEACEKAFTRLREHFMGSGSAVDAQFAIAAMPGKHYAVRKADDTLLVVANADNPQNALDMLDRISQQEGLQE